MDKYVNRKRQFIDDNTGQVTEKKSRFDDAVDLANKRIFGNDVFRTRQRAIIDAALNDDDVFVIMPTGVAT